GSSDLLDRRGGSGDRRARNVQDAVDVQENGGHGQRVYSLRSRVPLLAARGSGRPARAEDLDARRGPVRRRGLGGPHSGGAGTRPTVARPGRACGRARRAGPASGPAARDPSGPGAGAGSGPSAARPAADEADGCRQRAPARREEAAFGDEATTSRDGLSGERLWETYDQFGQCRRVSTGRESTPATAASTQTATNATR